MSKDNNKYFTTGFDHLIDTVNANLNAKNNAVMKRELGRLNKNQQLVDEGIRDLEVAERVSNTLHSLNRDGKHVDPQQLHEAERGTREVQGSFTAQQITRDQPANHSRSRGD